MDHFKKIILTFGLFLMPFAAQAELSQSQIKERMLIDLEVIKQTFEVNYAPKDWKKAFTDWELTYQIEKAKIKVLENDHLTLKEYQHILKDFFNSTKDYHVGVRFFSTEVSALPFRMTSTHGKYFIAAALKNEWAPLMDYSLDVGDEVLLFNNQPIDQVVKEFKEKEYGNPDSLSDQALAEGTFTMQAGLKGNFIPQGPVLLTVRKAGTNNVETYNLEWAYAAEMFSGNFVDIAPKKPKQIFSRNRPLGEHSFFHKDMTSPHYELGKSASKLGKKALKNLAQKASEEDDIYDFLGNRKSFLPPLGKVVWKSDPNAYIDAYIYETSAKKRIGYLRIPHYSLGEEEVEELIEIINLFEMRTGALVIDQLNNPGGSAWFMYALASMLSDKPLMTPKQQMMLTSSDIYFALEVVDELEEISTDEEAMQAMGETLGGYPVSFVMIQNFRKFFNFILSEWHEGRMFTQSSYLFGFDYLQPHPKAQYTKPILVLVNSLDFSCGDFFPAIMQDNQRATILGTQTAGAGGYVLGHEFLNIFGVDAFRFTGSIAERINTNPIENLGVTPDIWLEMTEKDLEFNYVDYINRVNKEVINLMR